MSEHHLHPDATYEDLGASYSDDGASYTDFGASYTDDGAGHGDYGASYADEPYSENGDYSAEHPADYTDDNGATENEGGPKQGTGKLGWISVLGLGAILAKLNPKFGKNKGQNDAQGENQGRPKAKGTRNRNLIVGLLLAGLLVAGGGLFIIGGTGDGDALSVLRDLPVVGDWLGPGAAAPSDKSNDAVTAVPETRSWSAVLTAWLPGGESSEVVLQHSDNLTAVKLAIAEYEKEYQGLPRKVVDIEAKLKELDLKLVNPYDPSQKAMLSEGEKPTAAGAIAYSVKHTQYQLRVGDKRGEPLQISGVELTLSGTGREVVAGNAPSSAVRTTAKTTTTDQASSTAAEQNMHASTEATSRQKGTVPNRVDGAGSSTAGVASGTVEPSPAVSLSPRELFEQRTKRNREFDMWRVRGISLLYSKQTAEALEAFHKALEIRPNDESVTRWVNAINSVIEKRDREAKAKYDEDLAKRLKEIEAARAAMPKTNTNSVPHRVRARLAPRRSSDDAQQMLDDLKKTEKMPVLAPPKLDH